MTKKPLAAKVMTLFAATAVATMATVPAMAETQVDAPATINVASAPNLKCGAEETYPLAYNGELDMSNVVAKWNSLKKIATTFGQGARFDALNVTAEAGSQSHPGTTFSMSFKLDNPKFVTVDEAILANHQLWTEAYKAANPGQGFTDSMVVDTTKVPTYDSNSGVIIVPMTLVPGLKAAKLNEDFKTLQKLNVRTPDGLLTVSKENLIAALNDGLTNLSASKALVGGAIRAVSDDARVNAFMGRSMPVDFVQAKESNVANVGLSYDLAALPVAVVSLPAVNGQPGDPAPEAARDEAQKLLGGLFAKPGPIVQIDEQRMITNPDDLPKVPAETKIAGGTLVFTGWQKEAGNAPVWAPAPELVAVSDACAGLSVYAAFNFIPDAEKPEPKPEPKPADPKPADPKPVQPVAPAKPAAPAKPMLPQTGTVAAVAGTASAMLLAVGAGLVAVRRRQG